MVKQTTQSIDYLATRMDSLSKGERSDCSVVAISLACNVSYQQAHAALAATGRKSRRGTKRTSTIEVIQKLGYKLRKWDSMEHSKMIASYPKPHRHNCKVITSHHLRRFPEAWKEKSKGTLLLFSSRHVLCAKAGVVLDWSINNALHIGEIYEVTKA